MFNISFSELIIILILAFLILGPSEIGKVARFLGKAVRESRKILYRIKEYVNEETGIDDIEDVFSDVEKDVKDVKKTVSETDPRTKLKDVLTEKKK